ncbi:MAG: hypothetical protein H0T66_06505 [Geodermatophilaceae bacterium]|nr:hypothetical protein [Geodermatophilaceae bacterium]
MPGSVAALGQQRTQEAALVPPHAAGLVSDSVGFDEAGIYAEAAARDGRDGSQQSMDRRLGAQV